MDYSGQDYSGHCLNIPILDIIPHPGVEHIVQEAAAIDPHINILFGGMHQIQKPDAEVERIAAVLHDQYKVERVAPGHCTGEPEFAALKRAFGDHYVYAGVGTVIDLPGRRLAARRSQTLMQNHQAEERPHKRLQIQEDSGASRRHSSYWAAFSDSASGEPI